MSTVNVLGYGVLRWPEAEGRTGSPGMVALHHFTTEQRLTLTRVPVGQTGLLVAVLDVNAWPGLADAVGLHARDAKTVSVALASGTVKAHRTAPGIKAAVDLVGCAPTGEEWCWLDHTATGLAADRDVRLEIHQGCACAPAGNPIRVHAAA
jgi:hypothetical protein